MNIMGLVFSILLILSFGYYTCFDKQISSFKLKNTYVSYAQVNRKILNSFQSNLYNKFEGKSTRVQKQEKKTQPPTPPKKKKVLNSECSKINLWPLIQEGREKHPLLYEKTAHLIRTFYPHLLGKETKLEYKFLDALLLEAKKAAKGAKDVALEKLSLPNMQMIHYKMLKGTKKWDLKTQQGYPPLSDYVKAYPTSEKICIFHANRDMLTILFNEKIADKLYEETHKKEGPPPTRELIKRLSFEAHYISVNDDLLNLLDFGRHKNTDGKKTFIADDGKGDVFLRKNIYTKTTQKT